MNITCSSNCKYRTAATLYPRIKVHFRYIIVNTLHKGGGGSDAAAAAADDIIIIITTTTTTTIISNRID